MEVIETIDALRRRLRREDNVACVPTMGNIHDGHLSLVHIARRHAPLTVTTIFVNRLQFGAGEDFDKYPRTFEEDCAKLEAARCGAKTPRATSSARPVTSAWRPRASSTT